MLAAFLVQIGFAGTATAATVILGGANGLNGTDGADGVPGEPGGNGGDAPATVTAMAVDAFQRNVAEATGGSGGPGGDGGDGGDAILGSGANGGNGGSGGMGGDAVAIATTLGLDSARAVATGGAAGSAGRGGDGSAPGVNGMGGSNAGVTSGSATATATIDRVTAFFGQFASIQGDAIAVGTNATATLTGEVVGNPNDSTAIHQLVANANGGVGEAVATASGMANHGTLNVSAIAEGTFGSDEARRVTATASGVHTGSGILNVTAITRLPSDFFGAAGVSNPSASGIATNGADVNVYASAEAGRHAIELRDAVSGSTSGQLTLTQLARKSSRQIGAGRPLSGQGAVRTRLVAGNLGGGDLEINLEAQNERLPLGSLGIPGDGDVILGDVRGVSTAGADVEINAIVRGFRLLRQQLDDPTSPSHIEGISSGGDVSVAADFRSGIGLLVESIIGSTLVAESAPSIAVVDAVRGQTSGQLSLRQNVSAAGGQNIPLRGPSSPPADAFFAGDGGDALSQLAQSGSFESLTIRGRATSGVGGRAPLVGIGGDSGSATTIIEGENDAGGVTLEGSAESVAGGMSRTRTGYGGDATVDLRATTFGDGHSILIGNERQTARVFVPGLGLRFVDFGAEGGNGGSAPSSTSTTPEEFGRGGNADSRADGLAHGDSEVLVYTHASGGSSSGGAAGQANSTARAEGGGTSRVLAQSTARGGAGIDRSGDALSSAHAIGFGEVEAISLSIASPSDDVAIGAATARSVVEVLDDLGSAAIVAEMQRVPGAGVRASVQRSTTGAARFEVLAGNALEIPVPSLANAGSAFVTRDPFAADVAQFTQGHAALRSLFEATPGAHVEALGQWSARGQGTGSTIQIVELDITLSTPDDQADLALAISSQASSGGGFELLQFRLEVLGEVFGEEMAFTSLSEATIYFSSVFSLGQAYREFVSTFGDPAVRAIFEVTIGAGQSITYGLAAVVVPEPSTSLLLGLGLLFFATSKTCRSE